MARFENIIFGAKPINIMVALLLLSTVSTRVLKITEDVPAAEDSEFPKKAARVSKGNAGGEKSTVGEFLGIVKKLSDDVEAFMEENNMQADQPAVETDSNRTEKALQSDEENPMHKWQREMALWDLKQKILDYTGHTDKLEAVSFPSIPEIKSLPMPPSMSFDYKREAIPPICPIKNDENLTVTFNISDPKASSKDMVLHVVSADLKLYKVPLLMNENGSIKYEDETAESKWRETFAKSDINASESAIKTKVDEQRMIQVNVYKIRNKNTGKSNDLKKLDTKMLSASYQGIMTFNVTKAINVWGNDTKKVLNLVITVEDDSGNKLSARSVFKMRCGNHLAKPLPLDFDTLPSERSNTAWLNLATEERPAKEEALNGAVSTINRVAEENDFLRTGRPTPRREDRWYRSAEN